MDTLINTTADTFGWDTVFALQIAGVNAAIIKAKTSPANFAQEIESGCSIKGTFTDWQVCMGGDGKLLHLSVPISTGQLTYNGTTTAFSQATAIVEVKLDFFDSTTIPPQATGVFYDLKVETSADQTAATVLTVNYANQNTDFMVQSLLPVGLTSWLNQNLYLFNHIFATININRIADDGSYQWLFPTANDYVYMDKTSDEDSLLAILCMTRNRSYAGLIAELTPNIIPDSCGAGFLINKALFFEEMVLPSLPQAFVGVTPADFALSADRSSVELVTSNLHITTTDTNGKTYKTQVSSLSLTIIGEILQMHTVCQTEISPGIYSHSDSIHTYTIFLSKQPEGQQTLAYKEASDPVVTKWTTVSEGLKILEWMIIAIGVVMTVVLGALTSGAAFVAGSIIIGALVGLASQIPNLIATVNTDKAPDLNLLVTNTTSPVQWNDSNNFYLLSAALNDSLQLGGTFNSTTG